MKQPDYTSKDGTVRLYCGDCLEILPTLPMASVASIITDPPYGINTKSDGSGKLSPWGDLCNSAYWYAAWIGEARRILRDDGCLWSFLNWRSLTTFQKASCDSAWPIESLLVWDKEWIGPGGSRGLRPSYEMVALWAMPDFGIDDRGLPDVQRFKWSGHKPSGHPAEKPETLIGWLAEVSGGHGPILDPFMGSGTTGEACARRRIPFIGCEMDEQWFSAAVKRIERAFEDQALFRQPEPKHEQGNMFAGGAA